MSFSFNTQRVEQCSLLDGFLRILIEDLSHHPLKLLLPLRAFFDTFAGSRKPYQCTPLPVEHLNRKRSFGHHPACCPPGIEKDCRIRHRYAADRDVRRIASCYVDFASDAELILDPNV